VLHRFFGPGIPLWLHEGFAEYSATLGWSAFHRARGFIAKPRSHPVAPDQYIPLATLMKFHTYPKQEAVVVTFYRQSERLVRFLSGINSDSFRQLLDSMSRGNRFDAALQSAYGSRFTGVTALEQEFRTYASKDHND